MINIAFITKDSALCGFVIDGHSGYARSGKDIVCSAVSALSHMAYVGIEQVLKLECDASERDGHMELTTLDHERAYVPLKMLEIELNEIKRQFPNYITITYRERRGL
ncbi:MAG: ribosomal-processing cysteine protease Prp [Clostridia bacterium]|nr:ribosomal-processing cysteine protease Prp [Clostridia bacterium]